VIFSITVRRVLLFILQHIKTFCFQGLHAQKTFDINSDLALPGVCALKDIDPESILVKDVIFVNWIFRRAKMHCGLADGDTAVSCSKQIQSQLSMAFLGSELQNFFGDNQLNSEIPPFRLKSTRVSALLKEQRYFASLGATTSLVKRTL